ncbi:hypothetical protein STIAU_7966 [Stigmatella aurantiaca DW4/3-1]|uniref:Uncharacterized protein n=1 Tax=Stigmatella aurantiaca (strain DW4/3-1) TaxID=378806 RepID=Q09C64_STIAD|nr:hypothetical protein STIAU_7966 [Stigmatella aurantiaca DW4/3-1]
MKRLAQLGQHLEEVRHEAVIGHLEDGGLGVLVDGHDGLRALHARQVLDGTADARGDVELRGHDLARLADLQVVGHPARVTHRARGAHRGAQLVGQGFNLLEVPLGATATGHHHPGLGQLRTGALHFLEVDELRLGRLDLRGEGLHLGGCLARRGRGELGGAQAEHLHGRGELHLGDDVAGPHGAGEGDVRATAVDGGDVGGHGGLEAGGHAGQQVLAHGGGGRAHVVGLQLLGQGGDDGGVDLGQVVFELGGRGGVHRLGAQALELLGQLGRILGQQHQVQLGTCLLRQLTAGGDGVEGGLAQVPVRLLLGDDENDRHLGLQSLEAVEGTGLDGLGLVAQLVHQRRHVRHLDARLARRRRGQLQHLDLQGDIHPELLGRQLLDGLALGLHDARKARVARQVQAQVRGDDGRQRALQRGQPVVDLAHHAHRLAIGAQLDGRRLVLLLLALQGLDLGGERRLAPAQELGQVLAHLVLVIVDGLLAQQDEVRLLLLHHLLEQRGDAQLVQRPHVVHPHRAVGAHRQRVPERLLHFLRADRDDHHLTAVLGGQPQPLFYADLIEGVDLVLQALLHDARTVGLDLDLGLGIFHALGGDEDLHGVPLLWGGLLIGESIRAGRSNRPRVPRRQWETTRNGD